MRKMSQAMLAARCALLGWDLTENGVTKIETQIRCVTDAELLTLALALGVNLNDFFSTKPRSVLTAHFGQRR